MKKSFSPRYRWGIFATCAVMYILSQFWRVSTAVIAGDLSHDLGISPEMLGFLGGAFFYSFGAMQLPMGPMLDRFGPRIIISVLGCIGAASAIVFALSHNVSMAILARAGIGLGMAAVLMGSYKIFTTWFSPHEFATLAGLMISIGNLGAICATAPLALLSETFGWRMSFVCMAAATLLITAVMYLVVRDHPPQQPGTPLPDTPSLAGILTGLHKVFGSSHFWRLAPLAFTSYGTLIVVQGLWGGPYLMHTYGMSKTAAGSILLATPVGVICGATLWGRWSDKIGRRKLPILSVQMAMLLVFSSLVLNLQLPRWGLLLQFWLLGLTYSSNTILYAQVKETFSLSIAGTALTALNFFVMLGAAVIQHAIGLIMSYWQPSTTGALPVAAYQWGFGSAAALLALALIIYTSSRDMKHESASS
ncbi:MAG: putative sulfoacetate transporter SauU [Smithella sp. PtaU1.Bin162]|nr:MAG: putative sulfoacetate transporter SauU [Smithella sp. PtaU1.Bin162]